MNLVIDTNVFVSALLSVEGASREVLRRCFNGIYKPLMGTALYCEYEYLLHRKDIKQKCPLTKQEREAFLDAYMAVCHWIPIYYSWRPNLRDEGDNHILELAVAGNATKIVTHNIRDFKQGELLFPTIDIVSPKQLLVKGEN